MDDDILEKFDQVTKIFEEKFQSTAIQQQNQTYIEHLYEQLNKLKLNMDEQIRQIIKEKTNEITQYYDQYCQEINKKYESIKEQIENPNLSSDIYDQIENLNIYCQSNIIEKRIHLNTIQFTKNELDKKIQLEYKFYHDIPQETTIIPLKTTIKGRNESISSIRSSSRSSSISQRIKRTSSENNSNVFDHEDDINTSNKPTKRANDLKPIVKERSESISSIHSSSRSSLIPKQIKRRPLKDNSSVSAHEDNIASKPLTDRIKKEDINTSNKPATITNDVTSKRSTKLYTGKHNALVSILINKNREIYNEIEKITEYSIDSITIPQGEQQQELTNIHNDNDNDNDDDNDKTLKLIHAYKVLAREKNDYQPLSTSDSGDEEEKKSSVNRLFNLQQFDQTNSSIIMFKKCETAYNCMSSSTKRNELLIYNSKLKILIILIYENNKRCHDQLFVQWSKDFSPNISDITYCQHIDHFLISTYDTCHIYLFNRDLLSIYKLGKLSNNLSLRRIHCYQETVYCILGNNYLLELQLNDQYKNLKFMQQIKLFNPIEHSHDEKLYLLDVTCDNNYLIVIYSNENDEIHLQSIHRETKKLHCDFIIDNIQPINQVYIRIESTNYNGNFVYLNGKQQILKAINLIDNDDEKIVSTIRQQKKPTNICFFRDGRLVILHEYPHYLSVHNLNNH
ncbi:unnamed protein product [Rotaria sordida]|uniref:Uncharacterized protein n=2 Tax=Rotaria sordida TaxID=392033 RepID=A0A818HZ97_9BILA|nr:unnamed protein product [Rotaria sordida]